MLDGAQVMKGAILGPYSRLRPGSEIGEGAHVGNFVETKKTRLGKGSKANHLTYLGDSEIGEGVNIGAGTITCNYDGVHKHTTVIEDGVFIGSDSTLVAPVKVGRRRLRGRCVLYYRRCSAGFSRDRAGPPDRKRRVGQSKRASREKPGKTVLS